MPPSSSSKNKTTARLRRAFAYPSSSSEDDDSISLADIDASPLALDEEHQERLILALQHQDLARTQLYQNLFLLLPALAALYFLTVLLHPGSAARARGFAVGAITSCGCTGYILRFLPLKDSGGGGGGSSRKKGKKAVWRAEMEKGGPVERYLVWCQAGLVGMLQMAAMVGWWRGGGGGGEIAGRVWRESLPLLVFALAMFARWQLRPLDLEELRRARYELKGA